MGSNTIGKAMVNRADFQFRLQNDVFARGY
jgi:hypothetical protein